VHVGQGFGGGGVQMGDKVSQLPLDDELHAQIHSGFYNIKKVR